MSRHGRRRRPAGERPAAEAGDPQGRAPDAPRRADGGTPPPGGQGRPRGARPRAAGAPAPRPPRAVAPPEADVLAALRPAAQPPEPPPAAVAVADAPEDLPAAAEAGERRPSCTTAQLRRFIKSRTWIPMHELRRRFGIAGGDDDVVPVDVAGHRLWVGLPPDEGRMLGELLAGGDVGYELSFDPVSPVVVGVYPMRPVARG